MAIYEERDGQPKRVNILLQLYLRYFVSANQKDWAKLLDVAQFSYNLQTSESTGRNPFQLVTRQQPLTPTSLLESYGGRNLAAYRFVKGWHKKTNLARSYLEKAAKRMKNWANKKRRLARTLPHNQKGGEVSYKLELFAQLKIHPVFHVSQLKSYHEDLDDPSRGISKRASPATTSCFDKEVESVLANRKVQHHGFLPYREYRTPRPTGNTQLLRQFEDLIKKFHEKGATRASQD
ncbi:hypothetical protein AMTR_s00046p00226540 [Amborella trichopoda]|uniref:Tf2-1-like SH3-like domain-containing protein n=1 Tax=Amborella trichopoda TaxID=13333 RepID=U5D9J3_AMBTC|nr:hypothetical protein AMTR_s00046p00226540 [Amborella trichopoda]